MQNLRKVFDAADKVDIKIAEQAWFKMNRLVSDIASKHGYDTRIGAAVFSSLSPNNSYAGNVRDVDRLLSAASAGATLNDFKVSSYGNNKRKAWRIVHGEDPLDLIVFPKTRNFFLNVLDPLDPWPVTVDGHVYNAYLGKRIPLKGMAQKGNTKLYEEVAGAVRDLAKEKGIIANVVQGIVWYAHKRMHRILYSSQLELWDNEAIHGNLGYIPSTEFMPA